MQVEYETGLLTEPAAWKRLADRLGGPRPAANSLIRHLLALGVRSFLVESRYIDRDFSADYRAFYAQTFRTYDRHCTRIHFFKENITAALKGTWAIRLSALETTSARSYCGFCVVRPLPHAPIGRTLLTPFGPVGKDLDSVVTARATYPVNLLGVELKVSGTPFMQQDSRVGACAQVSIWSAARHLHQRYGTGWFSIADITKLAAPSTSFESTSLPAGSDFLTSERMIRAVAEMGYQPLSLDGKDIGSEILPYVESGLPVLLGMTVGPGLGHAITVVGRVFSTAKSRVKTTQLINYTQAFIAHDDTAGPYMLLPRDDAAAKDPRFDPDQLIRRTVGGVDKVLTMGNGELALVLMPQRVFSTAAEAEHIVRRQFNLLMQRLPTIRARLKKKKEPIPDRLLNELAEAHRKNEVIFRTYLTSAAGYRRHIARGTATELVKDNLLHMHLPHYAWITEISTVGSYNYASAGMRRIYGHSVVDATASGKQAGGLLALHVMGLLSMRDVDTGQEVGCTIPNDALYECREKKLDH